MSQDVNEPVQQVSFDGAMKAVHTQLLGRRIVQLSTVFDETHAPNIMFTFDNGAAMIIGDFTILEAPLIEVPRVSL